MHQSLKSLFHLALILASSTSAAPTDNNQYTKVGRVPTGSQKNKDGILQLHKTYRKYNWEMPEKLAESANIVREKSVTTTSSFVYSGVQKIAAQQQKQGTIGSVSAVPQSHNAEFLCPITVGGQTLNLDIDTGSSDLWVFGTGLTSGEQGSHTLYDPAKSKTYTPANGWTFSENYGDGTSLDGTVVKDTVQIGGLYVQNQAIQLPSSVDSDTTTNNADGILGLGFQPLNSITEGGNPAPQPTWFENVMSQLVNPLFTVNLKSGKAGYYKFGQIDQTAFKDGTMWYTPIDNSSSTWAFQSDQYAIGNGETQQNLKNNSLAIADTGTSIFFVNTAPFNAFYANVKGKTFDASTGMTTYPCSESLPDFHVSVGNQMITVPGFLLNYMPDTNKGPNGEDMCVGGIQTNNHNDGPQVYGDILFELYFAVFDYGNMQIGLAPHA